MAKNNRTISPIPFLLLLILIISMFAFNVNSLQAAINDGNLGKFLCEMKPGFKYVNNPIQPKFISKNEYHCVNAQTDSSSPHGVCAPHTSCVN